MSHDRYFLENVAARMLELDRVYAERPASRCDGSYSEFLEKQDEVLREPGRLPGVARATACAREVEWLRRKAQGAHHARRRRASTRRAG